MTSNTKQRERYARLLPNGEPRWIRCYDNGGESADRYTVCFTGRAATERSQGNPPQYPYRGMSAHPFHPQGIGQWGACPWHHCDTVKGSWPPAIGRKCHLGRRIRFVDLPADCQRLVLSDYKEIWNLTGVQK